MKRRAIRWLLVPLTLSAGIAMAAERPLAADQAVVIEVPRGDVAVLGWDDARCQVTGNADLATTEDSKLTINAGMRSVDLEVRVPRGTSVTVTTVSADIWADGLTGNLAIDTVTGNVDIRGELSRLTINRFSGDLILDASAREADLTIIDGALAVRGDFGVLSCTSYDGDMAVMAGPGLTSLSVSSLHGDVAIAGTVTRRARWRVELQQGDARLDLAPPVDARLGLRSVLGEVVCGLPRGAEPEPDDELAGFEVFRGGGERATIVVDVLHGDVRVRVGGP